MTILNTDIRPYRLKIRGGLYVAVPRTTTFTAIPAAENHLKHNVAPTPSHTANARTRHLSRHKPYPTPWYSPISSYLTDCGTHNTHEPRQHRQPACASNPAHNAYQQSPPPCICLGAHCSIVECNAAGAAQWGMPHRRSVGHAGRGGISPAPNGVSGGPNVEPWRKTVTHTSDPSNLGAESIQGGGRGKLV